jgi:hypothetical protein
MEAGKTQGALKGGWAKTRSYRLFHLRSLILFYVFLCASSLRVKKKLFFAHVEKKMVAQNLPTTINQRFFRNKIKNLLEGWTFSDVCTFFAFLCFNARAQLKKIFTFGSPSREKIFARQENQKKGQHLECCSSWY